MSPTAKPTRLRQTAAVVALALLAGVPAHAHATQPRGIDPINTDNPQPREAPVRLIDRLLNERSARLISLDANALVIADDRGRTASVSPGEFIAIYALPADPSDRLAATDPDPASEIEMVLERLGRLPGDPRLLDQPVDADQQELPLASPPERAERPTTPTSWALQLTDGQRILGIPSGPGTPDTITFRADRLGTIEVELERIASIRQHDPEAHAAPEPDPTAADIGTPDQDSVTLSNGDDLRGFILRVAGDTVELERADGTTAAFPLDRVRALAFANPVERTTRPLIRLTTGEVLAAEPAAPGPDPVSPPCVLVLPDLLAQGLDAAPAGPARSAGPSSEFFARSLCIAPAEVRSIELPARTITPLADLPPDRTAPSADRRRADPPAIETEITSRLAPSIVLPGPMTITWTLPERASGIVFDARLGGTLAAPDAPPGPWADAVLRVSVRTDRGRVTVAEHRLWSEDGTARIAAPIPGAGGPGRELVIELDSANHGPIQDRVLLLRPFLLSN